MSDTPSIKETIESVADDLYELPDVDSVAIIIVRTDGSGGTTHTGAACMALLGAAQHLAHRISCDLDEQDGGE